MQTGVWPAIPLLIEFALKLVFIGVILSRRRPNPPVMLTWIVIILVLPIVGFVAYLLVGEVRLGTRRMRRHQEIVQRIERAARPSLSVQRAIWPKIAIQYQPIASLGQAVSQFPVIGGNEIELLSNTDMFMQRLVEDIDAATKHCHLLFYIYLADHSGTRVAEALIRAAERGVVCRVLVDGVGSKQFLRSALCNQMRQKNIRVVEALPASVLRMLFYRVDHRNHRKIAIIDGTIAYTGSQNIADAEFAPKAKYAPWIDTSVRVTGPIVYDLQMLFIEDWYLDTDESLEDLLSLEPIVHEDGMPAQVLGTGPNTYNEAMHQLMQSALHVARNELVLTTPYFVPDEATMSALCTAAHRGVETALVVPARNDSALVRVASRSYYEALLEAGVKLYEYHGGLLHSKTMTVDRDLALVTTANLDRRSFELNFEVSLVVYDTDFASQLRFLQRSYIEQSTPVHLHEWKNRKLRTRLWQNAVGILSPLL
jgi:cardiolipin synthase A/B